LLLIVSIYVHFIALSEELAAGKYGVNVRKVDASTVGVSLGEAVTEKDVEALLGAFGVKRRGLGAVRVP
jgi:glycine cleavage system pyridoxal-binding protein P